jgi:hypothetical protein
MPRGGKRPGAGRPANEGIVITVRVSPINLKALQRYFKNDNEQMREQLANMVEKDVRNFASILRSIYAEGREPSFIEWTI